MSEEFFHARGWLRLIPHTALAGGRGRIIITILQMRKSGATVR